MKYEVLVSHGKLADGLKDALGMLAGQRKDVIACGLENGKSADEFATEFAQAIDVITEDDEIILLGDLIGGSPLTTALNVINEKGFSDKTLIIGGMNLPLALTVVLMKDTFDNDTLLEQVLGEAHSALREFKIEVEDEDDI
ncbi:MAG: PTS fructose transporter subunit IIA [Erysipelotrichaceae bacterium]|nr:PTS fructose transporter subunit IIA [Erysipelotrichaceae bacterium]